MNQKLFNSTKYLLAKILSPQALQKFDRYLLLNQPRLWVFKLHYVAYYALLANLLIIFLVIIYPIKPDHVFIFSQINFIFLPAVGITAFYYWWIQQYLYDVKKQYNKIPKKYGFLEILGYATCIVLIASGAITFNLSMSCKMMQVVATHNQLNIDLLVLESTADKYRDKVTLDTYIEALKSKVNEQIRSDNCSIKYERLSIPKNTVDKIIRGIVECKHLNFLGLLRPSRRIAFFNAIIANKNYQLAREDLSDLVELVESITKGDENAKKAITKMIKRYTQTDIYEQENRQKPIRDLLYMSTDNAYKINDFYLLKSSLLFSIYIICNLGSLLLFLVKNTFFNVCFFGFFYITIAMILCLFITAFLSYLSVFSIKPEIIFSILCLIFILFIMYQLLSTKQTEKYSLFKVMNLVALPFAVIICVMMLPYVFIDSYKISENSFTFADKYFIIASLAYLPLIPYLKRELMNQLYLPKD
ncbi:MAG: hypothetical protein KME21_15090 [Desmonostoc vinosum HA7617-LM4]|jgi:hypothetical protein|nr:hypothetical protein [Desmonostoc vinosum HA7617-LM4]